MPTTLRPFSERDSATSSPPTPMPRIMASTSSAMMLQVTGDRLGRRPRLGKSLLEAHRRSLRPRACRFVFTQPLPAGAALLFAEQPSEAGPAGRLVGLGRAGQPCGANRIPVLSDHLRQVVELEHHAGDVFGFVKQLGCLEEVFPGALDVMGL